MFRRFSNCLNIMRVLFFFCWFSLFFQIFRKSFSCQILFVFLRFSNVVSNRCFSLCFTYFLCQICVFSLFMLRFFCVCFKSDLTIRLPVRSRTPHRRELIDESCRWLSFPRSLCPPKTPTAKRRKTTKRRKSTTSPKACLRFKTSCEIRKTESKCKRKTSSSSSAKKWTPHRCMFETTNTRKDEMTANCTRRWSCT
jgi:hypothetical protein